VSAFPENNNDNGNGYEAEKTEETLESGNTHEYGENIRELGERRHQVTHPRDPEHESASASEKKKKRTTTTKKKKKSESGSESGASTRLHKTWQDGDEVLHVQLRSHSTELGTQTSERYTLSVGASGPLRLEADTVYGALRGLETLSQLIWYDFERREYAIDGTPLVLEDFPRFSHRYVYSVVLCVEYAGCIGV
jgi:beta-acetyl hexosaminidase like